MSWKEKQSLYRQAGMLIIVLCSSFVLYRYVLYSTTMCVPLCPTSTICSWTWSSILGSLSTLPPRSCHKLSVWHTTTTVPSYVPTSLWWPPCIPCSVLHKRGDFPGKPNTHWDSICSSTILCARVQRTIPTGRGLLSSGPSSSSDQTFIPQGTLYFFFTYYINLIYIYEDFYLLW